MNINILYLLRVPINMEFRDDNSVSTQPRSSSILNCAAAIRQSELSFKKSGLGFVCLLGLPVYRQFKFYRKPFSCIRIWKDGAGTRASYDWGNNWLEKSIDAIFRLGDECLIEVRRIISLLGEGTPTNYSFSRASR